MTIHTAGRNTVISGVTGLPDINPTVTANPTTSDSCNYSCCFRINVSVGEKKEATGLENKKTVMISPKGKKTNIEDNSSEQADSEKSSEDNVKRQAIIAETVAKPSLKNKKKKKNCCF